MKLCGKCGAHNADDRMFCVDCDTKLGDPLSEEQEQQYSKNMDNKLDALYEKGDPLHVTKFDKVFGYVAIVGAVVLIVITIVRACAFTLPDGWGAGFLGGLFAFLFCAVEAFFPQLGWKLSTIRLWANGTEDLTPNDFYRLGRKIGIWMMMIVGMFICVMLIRGETMASS